MDENIYDVSKIIVYPGYNDDMLPNDDIAMLKLTRRVCTRNAAIIPTMFSLWKTVDDDMTKLKCRAAGKLFK